MRSSLDIDSVDQQRVDREVAEHEFIDRLFYFWDISYRGSLSLQVCPLLSPLNLSSRSISGPGVWSRRGDVQRPHGEH